MGHLDIIDVVDDVPAVAVTLNTNDFGDVRTLAILAQVPPVKRVMDASASDSTGNLVVVSGTQLVETSTYLHGVGLADFAITCGNLTGVSLWAPVQAECDLGTLANNIDQTLWLDEVYINSLEFSYTTGANATENYGAETDTKMWLLNAGRFVNFEDFEFAEFTGSTVVLDTAASGIATLSDGNYAFLRKDSKGAPAASYYDFSANEMKNYEIIVGAAGATNFGYNVGTRTLTFPTSITPASGDRVEVIYAAASYATAVGNRYMEILDDDGRPDMIGALRQGQVEIFIVDPQESYTSWSDAAAWRLTGCTVTADLTREPLTELGHLGPYDRPLTLPIPITVTVDSTAGDLENWAKVAGKLTEFNADTLNDLDLADLFNKEDLLLVVKVYAQTDEEAGGTGANRKVLAGSKLDGEDYWDDGVMATYTGGPSERERPLKTIIVEHLKITDEGMTLDMGANATQTFGFRSTNDLYVIKGDVSVGNITGGYKVRRNG